MRNLSVELLKESPSPALRACHTLAQLQPHVARELFAAGFISCWSELQDTYQEQLVRSLEAAFASPTIPPEIIATLLNLAEFMEHDEKPLPVDIRTLDGVVSMKVPSGTQPDTKLAMRGKGAATIGSSRRGDQIVTLKVLVPKSLTPKQRRLMEEFDRPEEEEVEVEKDEKVKSEKKAGIEKEDGTGAEGDGLWSKLKSFVGRDEKEGAKPQKRADSASP